jgi:hypothetical protein
MTHYFNFKNIEFRITENVYCGEGIGDLTESIGWCNYSYEDKVFKKFQKNQESDGTYCTGFFNEDSNASYDDNPDVFISFLDWFENTYSRKKTIIEVEAQHPFWVFHDISHADNGDVVGCVGNVTAWIERDRLQKGYQLMLENGVSDMDNSYKEIIQDSYYKRFKKQLNLEEFEPVYEYEEEEDWD